MRMKIWGYKHRNLDLPHFLYRNGSFTLAIYLKVKFNSRVFMNLMLRFVGN